MSPADAEDAATERNGRNGSGGLAALAELADRLGRGEDLDHVLTVALDSLDDLFGFGHSMLLLSDETGSLLFTIASRGYEHAGIGSEVGVGEGVIGMAAAQSRVLRVNNLQRMLTYARRAMSEPRSDLEVLKEIPLPGLAAAHSQLAAPAMVLGQLVGVLVVESDELGAFSEADEQLLSVIAHMVASAIELDRLGGPANGAGRGEETPPLNAVPQIPETGEVTDVRFFGSDGSTFVGGDYLIKGVPGRILFRLLSDFADSGRTEFTNRELRLDPALELPAYRDNFESRLILLKRRLDEREAPVRVASAGRGRFRLEVHGAVRLIRAEPT